MEKKTKIFNQAIEYTACYRNIRYPRLEFKTGRLVVIMPKGQKNENDIIEKHKRWIFKKNALIHKAIKDTGNIKRCPVKSIDEFKSYISKLVKKYGIQNGTNGKIDKIYFREMKSKWGSLSSNRNLTINTLARRLPEYLINYIVFHEMTHLLEKRHNERYWSLIKKEYKQPSKYESDLLKYWFIINN